MDPKDNDMYNQCALRELREELKFPKHWEDSLTLPLVEFPDGQRIAKLLHPTRTKLVHLAMWVIYLDDVEATMKAYPTKAGCNEIRPHTLRWRPVRHVIENLLTFESIAPVAETLLTITDDTITNTLSNIPHAPLPLGAEHTTTN